MKPFILNSILSIFAICLLCCRVSAEPVQYCRVGDASQPNTNVDFCVGITVHYNSSTSSPDLMLTITHTRHDGSNLGWTAVGIGDMMKGSLMFILYGDPTSHEAPIVSIRGATGHDQPTLVTQASMNGADLRVLKSAWIQTPLLSSGATNPDYTARVNLICYSCYLWPGTEISTTATSQPWIWAWNPSQEFDVYAFDAHLNMHTHHTKPGGYGNFYVDMKRSNNFASLASLPPIRPGVFTVGSTSSRAGALGVVLIKLANPALHLHGLLMGTAFFLIFPAGVVCMRSGYPTAFKYHWVLQLLGSAIVAQAMALGLMMRAKIDTVHQIVGISLVCMIGVQGILGWRHHIYFVRERQRNWVSNLHINLGRMILFMGLGNASIGMMLSGWPIHVTVVVSVIGISELVALTIWLWFRNRRSDRHTEWMCQSNDYSSPAKLET